MRTLVKYRGGKSRELPEFRQYIPNEYERYIEPFLGGSAVFFDLEPEHAIVNDINAKLIYPKQVKRELGAKLIYDVICPIATGAFYGFNPYEKDYGNMVAEDMGNSYEKCEQIADVAIEIEKHIKELSEQELVNEDVVKVILRQCFDGKEDISSMATGNGLDKLVEKVMELIREVYL